VTGWWVAALGGVGTLLLLRSQRFPAMLFLLAFGLVVGAWQQPERWGQLVGSGVQWQLPTWVLGRVGWGDLVVGAVLLALPQVPLTLGNAVIAIREENNRRFPQAPVTEKRLAVSTGLMNLFSASVGGVPQCHGAGGMAGHVAFGARTGGAVVILGGVLLVLGVFFSASVEHLLQLLPAAVLGIILCITGVQLALGGWAPGVPRAHHLVTGGTALVALWSVAAAFGVGLLMWQVLRRTRWVA
jgi:MFS superfamily sulfate permease-like transporter